MLFLICFCCYVGLRICCLNSTPLGVVLCNRQVLEGVAQQGLCIAFIIWLHPRRVVRLCFLFVHPRFARVREGRAAFCTGLALRFACLRPAYNHGLTPTG